MKPAHLYRRLSPAFSLVEVLVVITIMVLLLVLLVPAFRSIGSANQLTSASQILVAELTKARQEALARNRIVELRFFEVPPKDGGNDPDQVSVRAIQKVILDQLGELGPGAEIGRVVYFPGRIHISPELELSTQVLTHTGSTNLPGPGLSNYSAFRFRPNGSANMSERIFWTIVNDQDTEVPPANFATVQLDPRTGRVRLFRP